MDLQNIDILLIGDNPTILAASRVLKKYTEVSIFREENLYGIIPDVVIISEEDPYLGLSLYKSITAKYDSSTILYIKEYYDITSLSCLFEAGVKYLVTSDISGIELLSVLKTIARYPKSSLTLRYRTKFLNKNYMPEDIKNLSARELLMLGARLRGYSFKKICKMLGISRRNVNRLVFDAYKKLGIKGKDKKNIKKLIRFTAINKTLKSRQYRINKTLKRPDYYIIPRVTDYDWTDRLYIGKLRHRSTKCLTGL